MEFHGIDKEKSKWSPRSDWFVSEWTQINLSFSLKWKTIVRLAGMEKKADWLEWVSATPSWPIQRGKLFHQSSISLGWSWRSQREIGLIVGWLVLFHQLGWLASPRSIEFNFIEFFRWFALLLFSLSSRLFFISLIIKEKKRQAAERKERRQPTPHALHFFFFLSGPNPIRKKRRNGAKTNNTTVMIIDLISLSSLVMSLMNEGRSWVNLVYWAENL